MSYVYYTHKTHEAFRFIYYFIFVHYIASMSNKYYKHAYKGMSVMSMRPPCWLSSRVTNLEDHPGGSVIKCLLQLSHQGGLLRQTLYHWAIRVVS